MISVLKACRKIHDHALGATNIQRVDKFDDSHRPHHRCSLCTWSARMLSWYVMHLGLPALVVDSHVHGSGVCDCAFCTGSLITIATAHECFLRALKRMNIILSKASHHRRTCGKSLLPLRTSANIEVR